MHAYGGSHCAYQAPAHSRAGLAAGFDKNAEVVEALLGLGLGFMEIGVHPPPWYPSFAFTIHNGVESQISLQMWNDLSNGLEWWIFLLQ